jgi:16S rRNA processing protein RimM
MTAPRFDDLITIGRVVKPQGRRGEVAVVPLSDTPDRFEALSRVFVPGPDGAAREIAVESAWPHQGRFVVKLQGVDSIDDAEEYRGLDLRIAEEDVPALPPGSYYHYQLKGLEVVDVDGRRVGRVEDLLETGGAMVLVIRDPLPEGVRETLIPLADEFVKSVDVVAHRAVVRLPEFVNAQG